MTSSSIRQPAVVHVRRSARDLAQRGRFERAAIAFIARNGEPALISEASVAPGDGGVVKLFVGKTRTCVTGCAPILATKYLQAGFLKRCECIRAPCSITVEPRISGADRSNVAGQRAGHICRLHAH